MALHGLNKIQRVKPGALTSEAPVIRVACSYRQLSHTSRTLFASVTCSGSVESPMSVMPQAVVGLKAQADLDNKHH